MESREMKIPAMTILGLSIMASIGVHIGDALWAKFFEPKVSKTK